MVKIPEHSEDALKELEEAGIGFCTYANYESDHIIGYQKWGRGYIKYIIQICKRGNK